MNKPAEIDKSKGKLYSRPPLIPSTIDGRTVELFGDEDRLDILVGGAPLLTITQWQYHVLNGLIGHGGDTLKGLHDLVMDRFGLDLKLEEIAGFFRTLKSHELVNPEEQKRLPVVDRAIAGSNEDDVAKAQQQSVGTAREPEISGLKLFNPTFLLRSLRPLFWLGKVGAIFLAPLLVVAGFEAYTHWDAITTAFGTYSTTGALLTTLFLGLITVNAVAMMFYACAAYDMGASVEAVVLRLFFGFLPRLGLRVTDTEKLSRRQAMWMHATQLLARLFVSAVAIMIFSSSRHFGTQVADIALTVSVIAFLSFVVTACPFYRGSGYFLMVEFLDEPKLRAKAFKALYQALNRSHYQKIDPNVLLAYALVSILFTLLVAGLAFLIFGQRLVASVGPDGLIVIAALVIAFLWRTVRQLQKTNDTYWKNYRFERWRDRTLPSQEQRKIESKTRITFWRVFRLAVLAGAVLLLFQTYNYRPSGPVTMLPLALGEMNSDIDGIVEEVYFEGGEFVDEGTPVAQLATDDLEAQLRIKEAEMTEAETNRSFAQITCDRNQDLFDAQTISDVQLQRALAECASAQSKIDILKAEIDRLNYRIERSVFRMPFDGQLGSLYLQERKGTYLEAGEPIATVRDTSSFRVRMKLREVDLSLVEPGQPMEVRVYAYPDEVFYGEIVSIDPDVESTDQGKLVEMIGSIENRNGLLRSGMTGVAKTAGTEMEVWRIITQGIYRFFIIDIWARLP